ncbi:hypothetical protein ACFSR7_06020 [Cohnella sp. GCM10020058]|uniref:hypothetical protein n=1 Tax=Cohnella sp. GCM10020058 TaxID=3317330 RepID=UPI0036417B54
MFVLGKFKLGVVHVTPGIVDKIHEDDQVMALRRHHMGDWGDVSVEDQAANNEALLTRERLFSKYKTAAGVVFWIITEADRSYTTLLLPSENY